MQIALALLVVSKLGVTSMIQTFITLGWLGVPSGCKTLYQSNSAITKHLLFYKQGYEGLAIQY